jgi:hypothetical protein
MSTTGGEKGKAGMTPAERAEVNHRLVEKLKELVKDIPVDVIGHIDSSATCCRDGTVALVEVDGDKLRQ